MEIWHAGHIPIARSTARQRRSISAMLAYLRDAAASSWAASLDELFTQRMPDVLEQLGITRGLAHLHGVPRPLKIHLEHILDPARPGREQDDAVGQCQSFAEVVRHEQDGLLLAVPDPEQD